MRDEWDAAVRLSMRHEGSRFVDADQLANGYTRHGDYDRDGNMTRYPWTVIAGVGNGTFLVEDPEVTYARLEARRSDGGDGPMFRVRDLGGHERATVRGALDDARGRLRSGFRRLRGRA